MVGPRGKLEVGSTGVAGFVREVFGFGYSAQGHEEGTTQTEQEGRRNFEYQLRRSLGLSAEREQAEEGDAAGAAAGAPAEGNEDANADTSRARRGSRRATTAAEQEEEEEEEEEEESE